MAPQRTEYLFAVNAWCMPRNSSLQDIELTARVGAGAIGLWEGKFSDGEDEAIAAALEQHHVRAGIVMPRHWTILPTPLDPGGMRSDWRAKSEGICRSVRRLARFRPLGIMVGPGVSGNPAQRLGPVAHVVEGLKMIADAAGEAGVRIAFEPLALRRGAAVATFPETLEVLDKVGRTNVDILPDLWHSYPEPDFHTHLRANVDRIIALQVNDVRNPERSWCDWVMPGDGINACTPAVAALIDAGYRGWYDFEVFSDDGTWGNNYPDSLWQLPHDEFLRRGFDAFADCFATAKAMAAAGRAPS
jgi:sugar phosphate isomerase/epimerase